MTAIRLEHTLYTELANQLYPHVNPVEPEDQYEPTFGGVSNNNNINNNNNVYEQFPQYQPEFVETAPIPTEPPYRPVTNPPYRPIPITQRPFVQQPVVQQQPSFSGQAAPTNPHVIPMPAFPSPSDNS